MNTEKHWPKPTDEQRLLFRPVCCKTDKEWAEYEDYIDNQNDEDREGAKL